MYQTYNHRKNELLTYLQLYLLKKNLKMKMVIKGIYKRIKSNNRITLKQFNSIIKFLEREPKFVQLSREQIFEYFSFLIISQNEFPKEKITYESNTLTKFFT